MQSIKIVRKGGAEYTKKKTKNHMLLVGAESRC